LPLAHLHPDLLKREYSEDGDGPPFEQQQQQTLGDFIISKLTLALKEFDFVFCFDFFSEKFKLFI
jgi:hypothetical protein